MNHANHETDVSPIGVARAVVVALGAFGAAAVIGIVSDLDQWKVLLDARAGHLEMARAELSDLGALVAGILQLMATLAVAVPFCMWTMRANRHAHALSPSQVSFAPTWAIGWHFVPVANFWKPYQAMQEIWRATGPAGRPSPLPAWWAAWICVLVLGRLSGGFAEYAGDDIDLLILSIRFELAADVAAVLLAVFTARMVRSIAEMQARRPVELSRSALR